jgi:hypothetical protein
MTIQLSPNPASTSILDIYNRVTKYKEWILQPFFQRRLVWNDKDKGRFIETILKGYIVPEIYISRHGIDTETASSQSYVVDGQQRLSTIIQYINGDEMFSSKYGIRSYKDLSDLERKNFLGYNIATRDMGETAPEILKEIFSRINSTNYSLNAIEINNALYNGEYMQTAKKFVDATNFSENVSFISATGYKSVSRMEDVNYTLLLMTTILEGGYFTYAKEVEKYIEKYDNDFPQRDELLKKMTLVFNYINKINFKSDSIWNGKNNYFSLFCELSFLKTDILEVLLSKPEILKSELEQLETFIIDNKGNTDNEFGKYYAALYTGTNSRRNRITRGNLINEYLINSLKKK